MTRQISIPAINIVPGILIWPIKPRSLVTLILVASTPFGWVLTADQIPQQAAQFVAALSDNPTIVLLLLKVLLIVSLPLEATQPSSS